MLGRKLNLAALMATGVCSMIGASIYIVPFMIHRHVPGLGPWVLPAFLFAAFPALLAALAYALLASAMPRAGGSYVYASRGLHPYLGFVASFSQWFGLSIAIGVIAYVLVPFMADLTKALEWPALADIMLMPSMRLILALIILWLFVVVNWLGMKVYTLTLIPLMLLMFILGGLVIWAGWSHHPEDFLAAYHAAGHKVPAMVTTPTFNWSVFLSASAVLFSSFIGFDAIAQAGGEAQQAARRLPQAIVLTMCIVSVFYFVFTSAVYHSVPWPVVAAEAAQREINAASLLHFVLSPRWTIIILAGATVALLNDLPGMILSNSRLIFAWSADGVFPSWLAKVHPTTLLPRRAILLSGLMATLGIFGCHLAGDFFLGIDVLVISMLVNFLLMCLTLIWIQRVNPALAKEIHVIPRRFFQQLIGLAGTLLLTLFLTVHISRDFFSAQAWYTKSTWLWLLVMILASSIYGYHVYRLKLSGKHSSKIFTQLPEE